MLLQTPQVIKTDVLVIGGGGAGIRAAIEARKRRGNVLLVSRSRVGYGNNTAISMGMFSASGSTREPRDNPQVHLKDTVVAGRYLNNQELVEVVTRGAWQQVKDLEEMGVAFKKSGDEVWVMGVPGHTYSRNVTAASLGVEFSAPMRRYASQIGVRFLEGVQVTALLVSGEEVLGAAGMDEKGNLYVIWANAVVLTSGGAGEVFLRTNNAAGSTGDGFALAYESGLSLVDMEFVQFYPTTLGKYGGRLWAYEIILGRGGTLRNALGEDVLEKHKLRDFATMTRDRLAQAIMREILEGRGIEGGLTMDISALRGDKLEKVLSVIKSRRYPEKAIVAPAAHYFMGGIVINRNAETGLRRLFAAGEVCGGIHGANRLAGNAIADILVFGTIAGRQAAQLAEGKPREDPALARAAVNGLREMAARRGGEHLETLRHTLREIMWEKAGIIRNEKSLREALEIVEAGRKQLERIGVDSPVELIRLVKLANMFRVSEMVCRTALLRTESRGSHYRSDFPEENNTEWLKRILISKTDEGMKLSTAPVSLSKLSPPQSSL